MGGFDDGDLDVEAPIAPPVGEDRKQCPMCGEMIAAKAIKCRFCGEVLDASMRGMVASASVDASHPGWRRVRSGLATMYYSYIIVFACLLIMAIALGVAAAMAGPQGFDAEPPVGAMIVVGLCGMTILGAGIAVIVGQFMCAAAPEHSGARGLAIGAAACMVGNILLSIVGGVAENPAISGLGSLVSIIGSVLFILFIRRSAMYLNDHQLATSAVRFIIFGVSLFVGFFVFAFVAGVLQMPAIFGVVGIVMIVAALVGFIWYMRLIKSLMTAIDLRTDQQ
jgi:hypothetical protein